jgi:uncharacterized protein (TIGR02300 family)
MVAIPFDRPLDPWQREQNSFILLTGCLSPREAGPVSSERTDPLAKTAAKPELGTKRTCPECAARFYDLGKMPCECPKCDHAFEPEILLKSKKRFEDDKPKPKPEPAAEVEEETPEVEEVTAEGMSRMPEEVDEDGVAVTPDDEVEKVIADVNLDDDESEEEGDDNTLMAFDDDDDDVAAIIDTDVDKLKDDT